MREPCFWDSFRRLALRLASVVIAAVLSVLTATAHAQGPRTEASYAVKGVAADDVLNIRDAPNGKQIIARVPSNGRGIIAVGPRAKSAGGTWARVRYGTTTGWVNVRFLAPDVLSTSSTAVPRQVGAAGLGVRGELFNGTWNHARWSMSIDTDQVALVPAPSSDRPPRVLAAGSRDCGAVYERNLASLAVEEIPATFTDPRFYAWARSATRDQFVLVMVVTCDSPSHRFFFFLAGQQKMLMAEWNERAWLMYEEFEHGSRHVGR